MNFSDLPPEIIVRIFSFLPLDERWYLGDVNEKFAKYSYDSIRCFSSVMDFATDLFYYTSAKKLREILQLCAGQLIEIRNVGAGQRNFYDTFVQFQYPKLRTVTFAHFFTEYKSHANKDKEDVRNFQIFLNQNASNLRTLTVQRGCLDQFFAAFCRPMINLQQILCENIYFTSSNLRRLALYCTNLKMIVFKDIVCSEERGVLENLFRRCENLQHLEYRSNEQPDDYSWRFVDCPSFWKLSNLRVLKSAAVRIVNDEFIQRLWFYFPFLEHLDFGQKISIISNAAFHDMAEMQYLTSLCIRGLGASVWRYDWTDGANELFRQGRLKNVRLIEVVADFDCVVTLFESCKLLENVAIITYRGTDPKENPTKIVEKVPKPFHTCCIYVKNAASSEYYGKTRDDGAMLLDIGRLVQKYHSATIVRFHKFEIADIF